MAVAVARGVTVPPGVGVRAWDQEVAVALELATGRAGRGSGDDAPFHDLAGRFPPRTLSPASPAWVRRLSFTAVIAIAPVTPPGVGRFTSAARVTRGIVPSASGFLPVAADARTRVRRPPASTALIAGHPRPPDSRPTVTSRVVRSPRPPKPGRVARRPQPTVTAASPGAAGWP